MERKIIKPVLELMLNSVSFNSGHFMPLITITSQSVGDLLSRCNEEGFFKDEYRFLSGVKFSGQVINVCYSNEAGMNPNPRVILTYQECRTLGFPKAINQEISYSVKA
jgi:hypothetical protein